MRKLKIGILLLLTLSSVGCNDKSEKSVVDKTPFKENETVVINLGVFGATSLNSYQELIKEDGEINAIDGGNIILRGDIKILEIHDDAIKIQSVLVPDQILWVEESELIEAINAKSEK